MCHLSVDLAILSRYEEAGKRINHESVDFFHTVLKVERLVRLKHVAIVQDYGLEDCPSLQLQLLTSLYEPLYQHLAHL